MTVRVTVAVRVGVELGGRAYVMVGVKVGVGVRLGAGVFVKADAGRVKVAEMAAVAEAPAVADGVAVPFRVDALEKRNSAIPRQ